MAHAARERVHVDTLLAQLFGVGDFGSLDELHDEHRLAGILRIGHRGRDPFLVGQLVVEAHEVVQLGGEIHLAGRRTLDFLDEAFERQQNVAMRIGSELAQGQQVLHEHDVLGHRLSHARAAHLHGHRRAVEQRRLVHLSDGGRAQRHRVDGGEHLVPRLPVRAVNLLDHHVEGHRVCIVAQFLEGIAVSLGQKVGAVRGQLADLHVGGAKGLQHLHRLGGSQPMQHLVLAHDAHDFVHARMRGLVLEGNLGDFHELFERGHGRSSFLESPWYRAKRRAISSSIHLASSCCFNRFACNREAGRKPSRA